MKASRRLAASDLVLVAAALALASGCASGGSADPATANDPTPGSNAAAETADVPSLEDLVTGGPAYTPFDVAPTLVSGSWLSQLLGETLLPVIESRELPPDTRALIWGLVAADGTVPSAVVQTTSGDAEFDEAAVQTVRELRYEPARRDGSVVPVWILIDVSLLLR